METILNYIANYGEVSLSKVQDILGVKKTRAYIIMKQLVDANVVKKLGRGKNQKYIGTE